MVCQVLFLSTSRAIKLSAFFKQPHQVGVVRGVAGCPLSGHIANILSHSPPELRMPHDLGSQWTPVSSKVTLYVLSQGATINSWSC